MFFVTALQMVYAFIASLCDETNAQAIYRWKV